MPLYSGQRCLFYHLSTGGYKTNTEAVIDISRYVVTITGNAKVLKMSLVGQKRQRVTVMSSPSNSGNRSDCSDDEEEHRSSNDRSWQGM